jgi:transcriptional regulator with XRE-family HTH domain
VNETARPPVGALLRGWRERRRLSQLDLAMQAGVSARHVSFVETGRSQPSREMVLRLADELNVPLRERNPILLAAGYAPAYPSHPLDDDEMAPVRAALDLIVRGYQPYPALAVDRGWNLVTANSSVGLLIAGAAADLLQPPVNVLRLSLHPDGLAGRIRNLAQWRGHLLNRLAREVTLTGDGELAALYRELLSYPVSHPGTSPSSHAAGQASGHPVGHSSGHSSGHPGGYAGGAGHGLSSELAVPLRLAVGDQELVFLSTVTTFGTAIDVTLAELSVEAFLPADAATVAALATLTATTPATPATPVG